MVIEKRTEKLNKVRKDGYIAGVLFGKSLGNESISIQAKPEEFVTAYSKYGMVKTFKAKLDGVTHEVYFKDIIKDVLQPTKIVHFSLLKVAKGDKVSALMPIKLIGEDLIEKQGMIVIQSLHEIEVEYPVGAEITHVEVNVGSLEVGESVHVSDIKLNEGFKVFLHPEDVIATVGYPKVQKEPEPTPVSEPVETATEEPENK